jgi:hypothetical protein
LQRPTAEEATVVLYALALTLVIEPDSKLNPSLCVACVAVVFMLLRTACKNKRQRKRRLVQCNFLMKLHCIGKEGTSHPLVPGAAVGRILTNIQIEGRLAILRWDMRERG